MCRTVFLCLGVALASGAGPARAADGPTGGIEEGIRKAVLEQRKAVLQAKMKEIEARVAKTDALAPLRRAAAEAGADYDRRRQSNIAIFAARANESAAERELDDLVAARLASPERAARLEKERAAFGAERERLRFVSGLTGLRLKVATQVAQPDADEAPEVKRLAAAVRDAENALRETPSQPLAEAREALRQALSALAPLERKLADSAGLQALAAAERAAAQAAREAEQRDERRAAVESARQRLREARQSALAALPEAQPFLKEIEAAGAARQAWETKRRGLLRIAEAHREALSAASHPQVAPARDAADAAKAALDRAIAASGDLRQLDERAKAAAKAADAAGAECAAKTPESRELAAKIARQDAEIRDLAKAALSQSDPAGLDAAAGAVGKALAEGDALLARQREMQAGPDRQDLDAARQARGAAERALRDALSAHPDAARAQAVLASAEQNLKQVIEAALPQAGASASVARRLRAVERDLVRADGRIAVARYPLENERSAIHAAVEADAKVAAARGAMQQAERALRGDPPKAVAEAQARLAEARRLHREAFDAAKDDGYDGAVAARKTAEARLQKAERDDPARARLEATRKAWQEQRQAALARDEDVRRAQEEHDQAMAAQRDADERGRGLQTRATDEARALRDGDDPAIAAARAKLEAARKAMRDVENAPETLAAKAKADAARQALEAKAREAAMADESYRAAAAELAQIEAQLAAPAAPRPAPARP